MLGGFWRLLEVQIGHFGHRFFDVFVDVVPRAAKSGPRAAKSGPERPKSGQEGPKSGQEGPKSGARGFKSAS